MELEVPVMFLIPGKLKNPRLMSRMWVKRKQVRALLRRRKRSVIKVMPMRFCEDSHGNDVGMDEGEVEDGNDDEEIQTELEISDPETNEELWFLVFLCFLLFVPFFFGMIIHYKVIVSCCDRTHPQEVTEPVGHRSATLERGRSITAHWLYIASCQENKVDPRCHQIS